MAKELRWETFDEEEALSPAMNIDDAKSCETKEESSKFPKAEDFEFRASGGVGLAMEMCAADEVFFQGQLLPLRPALRSEIGLFSSGRHPFSSSQDSSKCGSRSDSMDYSSSNASLGIGTSRSISSGSSSCTSCVSRNHSSKSFTSATAAHQKSISNKFYAQPSPSPQLISSTKKRNAARKTNGSWWGLCRLGLLKAPEIELDDLKFRKTTAGKNYQEAGKEKKVIRGNEDELRVLARAKIHDECVNKVKVEKRATGFFVGVSGLSCKCSLDSVDTISSRILIAKKKKKEEESRELTQHIVSRNRTFEWLEELSLAK